VQLFAAIKKELGISDEMMKDGNYFRRICTGGLRGELELTKEQVVDIIEYAKQYGIKDEDIFIKYNDRDYTSYARLFGAKDVLYINSDVMPAIKATTANSRVSWKGAIAHELEGHRAAALIGKTHPINELEEVQASIRASKFGKDLTEIERNTLWDDAMERLEKYGKNYEQIKDELWLDEF